MPVTVASPASVLAACVLAACASVACAGKTRGPDGRPLPEPLATAKLQDSTGKQIGIVTFTDAGSGSRVGVSVAGLGPGAHGIHVHSVGSCVAPAFTSAGPHFNPAGRKHGLANPAGPHAGDLPNLLVGPDGSADTVFTVGRELLGTGPGSILGAPGGTAVVVHAGADDNRTDPAGNSGGRIACGVVERG
jgi:superoxide dismutase, Cu-Zn family